MRVIYKITVLAALISLITMTCSAQERQSGLREKLEKLERLRIGSVLPGQSITLDAKELTKLVFPLLNPEQLISRPFFMLNETNALLYREITKRLGVRYRFYGTDDRGYDCSGFVWKVFQSAGSEFERVAARSLWHQLPEATEEEKGQFGTLIFFNGLKHVGIVRDAKSFYHASRSHGVTLSTLDGYWGERITGYRRAPAAMSLGR